jgi:Secretion system C-terminal sorting domain
MRGLTLIVIIVLCTVTTTFSQAPDVLWTRTMGGTGVDICNSIQSTDDGGFIIGGYTNSFGEGETEVLLIKTYSDGEVEWDRTYGSENTNRFSFCTQKTNDGGFVSCGVITNSTHFIQDIMLIKTYSDGNVEWSQTFGGEYRECGYSIYQTEDDGYIVSGYIILGVPGPRKILLLKIDSDGNEEWNQIIDVYDQATGYTVKQSSDGGYLITGTAFSVNETSFFLIKTDLNGEVIWNQSIPTPESFESIGSQETEDGGYVILGNVMDEYGNLDMSLIKTDSSGGIVWNQMYEGCSGNDIQLTGDNGLIITGATYSEDEGINLWILKTDFNGETLWELSLDDGGSESGSSIDVTDDGGYIVSGLNQTDTNPDNPDVWLIRLGSETAVSESDSPIPSEYVLNDIYPNPFNSMTTISVGLPQISDLKIMIYNINGQRVATLADRSYSAGTLSFTFNADDLGSGVYFVQAVVEGKLNQIQKVVLIR